MAPLRTNFDVFIRASIFAEHHVTDCPISGVFGAGKTRAAAAMTAGLMVMDPTLKVMVVTKENAAAHAFAKHIESLQLPPSPAGALAHVPCRHTKGGTIRVGFKDGGKRERYYDFYYYYYLLFFFPHPPFEQVPLYGEATLKSWGAVRLYALVCGMTNQPINK